MIADTNFILRAFDTSDEVQGPRARKRIKEARSGETIAVTASTVCEVAYVLRSEATGYGYSIKEISDTLTLLLDEPGMKIQDREIFLRAIKLYQKFSVDFHDCYLAAMAGLSRDKVISFDKDFAKLGVIQEP